MKIHLLAMDVDGTLTDGTIYIGPDGEVMKGFSVKDGMGIAKLHSTGVKTAIITGRSSTIVSIRAKELGVCHVHQGVHDKLTVLKSICDIEKISLQQVAYIGDDINDMEIARNVGFSFAPKDAAPEMKQLVQNVVASSGGKGAVRDCVEHILAINNVYGGGK